MPIVNLTKHTWLATRTRWADNFFTRLIGLLGRKNLAPEEAFWLVPSKGIHTVGMRFPIDAVFLGKDRRVVNVVSGLRPYSVTRMDSRAHSVLELPEGTIRKSQTDLGDQIEISDEKSVCLDELTPNRFDNGH